ncbi:MAG: hypothetical protein ABIO43_06900 [Sphingomicrobium sp.]
MDAGTLADLVGVHRNSQYAYEKGRTPAPADYLLRLGDHGVDIGYVLTGHRISGLLEGMDKVVLDCWNELSLREREAVMSLLLALTGRVVTVEQLSLDAAAAAKQRREIEGELR